MNLFIILVPLASLMLLNNKKKPIVKEELFFKHWAGNCHNLNCDTLTFIAYKKFNSKLYKWGGYAEGFEFEKDGTLQTFHNIHCSDESSPIDHYTSIWKWKGRDSLILDTPVTIIYYRVLSLSNKKLKLLSQGYKMKKE